MPINNYSGGTLTGKTTAATALDTTTNTNWHDVAGTATAYTFSAGQVCLATLMLNDVGVTTAGNFGYFSICEGTTAKALSGTQYAGANTQSTSLATIFAPTAGAQTIVARCKASAQTLYIQNTGNAESERRLSIAVSTGAIA